MTKVTLHYDLTRKLSDEDCTALAAIHGVYGMALVSPSASLDRITVDYDASRLSKHDVESTLARFSLPIKN